ncbi:MAG: phosphate signaling complex protein PhoU [Candidatus Lokiarchaeota archaeon]|nr:phosphate signaling complex protein PhoU [Candidatus Lokiarchaeota archaeon]
MHDDIRVLKKDVLSMGNLALEMLGDSMNALISKDLKLAKSIEKRKSKIREYDEDIENRSLHLLTLYHPMAKDLRRVATILKIITYLTRIGRYGKDIAKVVEELAKIPSPEVPVNLKHMWEHVQIMITKVLVAFDKSQIQDIKDLEARDNEVDELRWSIFRECVAIMMENPKFITTYAHYLMVARYLERCGDHACKMAEKIHYMVTGEHVEIS